MAARYRQTWIFSLGKYTRFLLGHAGKSIVSTVNREFHGHWVLCRLGAHAPVIQFAPMPGRTTGSANLAEVDFSELGFDLAMHL
jgi:hypothetical protein